MEYKEVEMNFIDFHCHLDYKDFEGQRKKIIDECFNSGFSRIVTVADPYEKASHERTLKILEYNNNISCMTAAHPHNADQYNPEIEKKIFKFLENKRAIAVGEAGLDFHYNLSTPENQLRVFKRQINIAREVKMPLLIHSREAEEEILRTLEQMEFDLPVIFHCYTGNMKDAKEILEKGYYISISGIVTFKKSEYLREIVKILPINRIFYETDSPYLSPEPFRGKLNTPLRAKIVAEKIAEIKNISIKELNKAVNENFNRLMNL